MEHVEKPAPDEEEQPSRRIEVFPCSLVHEVRATRKRHNGQQHRDVIERVWLLHDDGTVGVGFDEPFQDALVAGLLLVRSQCWCSGGSRM
jgi:hypothetical protein